MRPSHLLFTGALLPCTAALGVMLGLSALAWRTRDGDEPPLSPALAAPKPHPATDQTRQIFGWPKSVQWTPLTNSANPFFTLAIRPAPVAQPPPPAPATRKVEVTYRGFYETSAGIRRAVVQVADKQVLALRGEKIVADLVASEIELRHLTLSRLVTNAAPAGAAPPTNPPVRLEFAKPQAVEIPAK